MVSSDKKIIFLDVDGTLVDYRRRLPASASDAIRKARARGHRVYICTGRCRADVDAALWNIGLDGMIGGNGNYVESHGKCVLHRHLSAEQCRRIVDWLHGRGLVFYLENNGGQFASETFEETAQDAVREFMGFKGKDADGVNVRTVFPNMVFGADLYRDDLNKVCFLLSSAQDFSDCAAAFPDLYVYTWSGAGDTELFGDICVRGITKGSAINALLAHLGADRTDTVAFGDAKVDIPMFEACAYSVCMGGGAEEAKAAADYVADSVEDNGLYKAFQTLSLIS